MEQFVSYFSTKCIDVYIQHLILVSTPIRGKQLKNLTEAIKSNGSFSITQPAIYTFFSFLSLYLLPSTQLTFSPLIHLHHFPLYHPCSLFYLKHFSILIHQFILVTLNLFPPIHLYLFASSFTRVSDRHRHSVCRFINGGKLSATCLQNYLEESSSGRGDLNVKIQHLLV